MRQPTLTTVTTTFRREAFAAQAGAANSTRARKRAYVRLLVGVDLSVVALAVWGGYLARFQGGSTLTDIPYEWVGLGLITLWMLFLVWSRCYDDRVLGYGADEYRRVLGASLRLAGSDRHRRLHRRRRCLPRLPRHLLRGRHGRPGGRPVRRPQALHRARSRDAGLVPPGAGGRRRAHVLELVTPCAARPYAGYQVVGACIPDALLAPVPQRLGDVPVVGSFRGILEAAAAVGADTVAVTASAS